MPRSHLMHSWAIAILSYWWAMGVSLVVSVWVPGWEPVVVIATVDDWVALLIGACLASGATMALSGGRRWRYRSTRYALERIGLILLCGGWLAFTVSTLGRFPDQLTGWLQGVVSFLACVLRLVELHREEKATRANVASVREAEGDA